MSALKVLLVDDNPEIRHQMRVHINWASFGFQVVGDSEQGEKALEKVVLYQVDVIYTQIEIPYLDGFDQSQQINYLLLSSKPVIFSGYDQFIYVTQMNPQETGIQAIHGKKLPQVLSSLKDELEKKDQESRDKLKLQAHFQANLPILQEYFYHKLLNGQLPQEQIALEERTLNICFSAPFYAVALIKWEDTRSRVHSIGVKKLWDSYFHLDGYQINTFFYQDFMGIFLGLPQQENLTPLTKELNRMVDLCQVCLKISLQVGLGCPCNRKESIPTSTEGAKNALCFLEEKTSVIYIGDVISLKNRNLIWEDSMELAFIRCIKFGTEEEIKTVILDFVQVLYFSGGKYSERQLLFMELLSFLLKFIRSHADLSSELLGEDFVGKQLSDFHSMEEMTLWLHSLSLSLAQTFTGENQNISQNTIEKAKEFIKEHYGKSELSVEFVCEYLHLSPSYFSTLFKKETSSTFTAFVTTVRMEKAKNLLQTTRDKTYLIGEKVGYADSNYFSYVFKRHVGQSPTAFRSSFS